MTMNHDHKLWFTTTTAIVYTVDDDQNINDVVNKHNGDVDDDDDKDDDHNHDHKHDDLNDKDDIDEDDGDDNDDDGDESKTARWSNERKAMGVDGIRED